MEEQLTSEKPTEQANPDLKAEMKAFVEKESKEVEKQEDETPKEASEPEKKETEEPDEEDKESKDKEEEDDKEKEDDKKGRPNRYQKQKAKIQALEVQNKKLNTDLAEAIRLAHLFKNRATAFAKKYAEDMEKVRKGHSLSDAEQENWVLKAQQEEKSQSEQIRKQQEKALAEQEIIQAKQEMSIQYQNEALSLAKNVGLTGDEGKSFARKVLRLYAIELKEGNQVTMKQVAQELAPLIKQNKQAQLEKEQFTANAGAPRLVNKGSGRMPNYEIKGQDPDKQKETMKQWLESLGKK